MTPDWMKSITKFLEAKIVSLMKFVFYFTIAILLSLGFWFFSLEETTRLNIYLFLSYVLIAIVVNRHLLLYSVKVKERFLLMRDGENDMREFWEFLREYEFLEEWNESQREFVIKYFLYHKNRRERDENL